MSRPWRHPKTGIYWLRKGVPDALRAAVGKREEKFSLKTRDPVEAKRLHARALIELEQRWGNLRAPIRKLDNSELHRISIAIYENCLNSGDVPGVNWDIEIGETLWERDATDYIKFSVDKPIILPGPGQLFVPPPLPGSGKLWLECWCHDRADELISTNGLKVDDEDRLKIAKAISTGAQRAALALKRRAKGDFTPDSPISLAKPAADLSGRGKPSGTVTLESLLEGWAAEKQPAQKTIYSWTRVLEQLGMFIGHDDATRLTPEDFLHWKAALIEGGLRTKTIRDSKIAPVRAILKWGVDNRKITTNPASRILVDVRGKMADRIRSFTDNEAALILREAARHNDPVRRWVPLLCAYSGARISEVCQLRDEDIIQYHGVWSMKFDPEAGALKNANSERAVPLHPAIVANGFLEFIASQSQGPLFPGLAADRFGNRGGNGTKIIGRWVRGLGLTDPRISPSHSWRHRFKTLGRRYGLMPDIVNALTGHHRKTVADSYGEYPIEALYRELSKIPPVETL